MVRIVTIGLLSAALISFALWVPLAHLFDAFQQLIVAVSIMAAAILVRLNRGMPTLDWKSLDPIARVNLTANIVEVTREYVVAFAINGSLLFLLVSLTIAGKGLVLGAEHSRLYFLDETQRAIAAVIGGLVALSIARMAYVVWRDYDIVRLQKALIDAAAKRDELESQTKIAGEKIASIKQAGLRSVGVAEPKSWE